MRIVESDRLLVQLRAVHTHTKKEGCRKIFVFFKEIWELEVEVSQIKVLTLSNNLFKVEQEYLGKKYIFLLLSS